MLDPEDGVTTIVHNVRNYSSNDTVSRAGRTLSSPLPLLEVLHVRRICNCDPITKVFVRNFYNLTKYHVPSSSDSLVTAINPKATFRAALIPPHGLERIATITDVYFKSIC